MKNTNSTIAIWYYIGHIRYNLPLVYIDDKEGLYPTSNSTSGISGSYNFYKWDTTWSGGSFTQRAQSYHNTTLFFGNLRLLE